MNPALLQQPPSFDFGDKYLGTGRSFPNPSFSANELSYSSQRAQSNLSSATSGVALPANPSLDFNGNSLLSEAPYHQNHPSLLSPPDSTTGSVGTSGNTTASSNAYTTLPKPLPSNVCGTDHFSSAPPAIFQPSWPSPMTALHRDRVSPLSPPRGLHSYSPATNGIGSLIRTMDPNRFSQYSTTLPPQISQGLLPLVRGYPHNSYPPRTNGPYPFSIPEAPYQGHNMSQDPQSCGGREGPPFHETHVHHSLMTLRAQPLVPEITATIAKGFFQVDHKWTCYRRNYFSVACSFSFGNGLAEGPFYLTKNGSDELVQQFAVSISAKTASTTNGESEPRGLVQHTPKRDKATESVPCRQSIAPVASHSGTANGTYSNGGHMYPNANHIHSVSVGCFPPFETPGSNSPPISHTFERIQFQKATANNGKRRAQQQYFLVVVELAANIGRQGNEDWVVIATKESDPMVVRGRSPGHYKDNGRRDSQNGMDPDCGSDHGGSGHSGPMPTGSFGHGHGHPSVDWGNYRGSGGPFGGSGYRHSMNSRFSPASMVSSSNLAETTTDFELNLSDSRTAKSSGTMSSDRSAVTPTSDDGEDVMFSSLDRDTFSRKRPFEDDDEVDHMRFSLAGPFTDSISSLNDFSTLQYSKMLCATS